MAQGWKIDGKIGCHFPDRGNVNVNFDVCRIAYSEDGVAANLKEIEKVYYISPEAAAAIQAKSTQAEKLEELQKWLVWHRYWGQIGTRILEFDQNQESPYFEVFTAMRDMTVQAINVFTDNNTNNNVEVYIVDYDTGLTVGYGHSQTIASNTETIYDLPVYKRTINLNNNVNLKLGKKYYIICRGQYNSNFFNMAHFSNETLKNVDANGISVGSTTYDLSNKTYGGVLSGTAAQRVDQVMDHPNEVHLCMDKPTDTPFNAGNVYERGSNYSTDNWYGICSGENPPTGVQASVTPTLASMIPMHSDDLGVANKLSWDPNDGFSIFRRTNVVIPAYDHVFSGNAYNESVPEMAAFINTYLYWSDPNVTTRYFLNDVQINGHNDGVASCQLDARTIYKTDKSKYVIGNLNGQSTMPESPMENTIYYKTGRWGGVPNYSTNSLVRYKNGAWQLLDYTDIFEKVQFATTDAYTIINNGYGATGWTTVGQSNLALKNANEYDGKYGYITLDLANGTTVEI